MLCYIAFYSPRVCLFTALFSVMSFVIYVIIMVAIYILPLAIRSPCIIEKSELPTKPLLLAHKGASAVRSNSVFFLAERKHSVIISTSVLALELFLYYCYYTAATWSLKSPKVPFLNTWSLVSLNLKKWSLKSLFLCNWQKPAAQTI